MPASVSTNSPWRVSVWPWRSVKVSVTGLIGWPAWRLVRCSDQPSRPSPVGATSKPQLAARKGAMSTPRSCSQGAQRPSEPRRDQLPPPRASRVARGWAMTEPTGAVKVSSPASVQPCQLWRVCTRTPCWRSRLSQARSKGAAFISCGKTRPELPTKAASMGARALERSSKRWAKRSKGSECVMFRPPRPASRNLRPTDGMASNRSTRQPLVESFSAAMSPAGPPPMMATSVWITEDKAGSETETFGRVADGGGEGAVVIVAAIAFAVSGGLGWDPRAGFGLGIARRQLRLLGVAGRVEVGVPLRLLQADDLLAADLQRRQLRAVFLGVEGADVVGGVDRLLGVGHATGLPQLAAGFTGGTLACGVQGDRVAVDDLLQLVGQGHGADTRLGLAQGLRGLTDRGAVGVGDAPIGADDLVGPPGGGRQQAAEQHGQAGPPESTGFHR